MLLRDIIVIGASAGGIAAVEQLVAKLPATLPAAVFVVVHISRESRGYFAEIFNRAGKLNAALAQNHEPITRGRIYVAPPDLHLLIMDGEVRLSRGPRENGTRPAIDRLFRTAASVCGPRVIGVLLTGILSDGTAGLQAIKAAGGLAVVQDPADARFGDMPRHALEAVPVDAVLPLAAIPEYLYRHTDSPEAVAPARPMPPGQAQEVGTALRGAATEAEEVGPMNLTRVTCPSCGGVLSEVVEGKLRHFACHVGHSFTPEALEHEQQNELEDALWAAVRLLKEQAMVWRQRAAPQEPGAPASTESERRADTAERHAETIRDILLGGPDPPVPSEQQ